MRRLLVLLLLPCLSVLSACSWVQGNHSAISGGVGAVGAVMTMKKLAYLKPENTAALLITYAIYDPLAPTWSIKVTELESGRRRIDLDMKRLSTGGDGEARQIFVRVARFLAEEDGYVGYDELGYQEGIDSTRPFAHRVAEGEIRLVKSRQFPTL
ncbi:hypothetical protein FACS1894116_08220 [Betaproteobacteria bacterium]|nr:hypothetical protein FACS1894116_08220 [Betaproteobacteria bacterium]GHU10347.1 hypothetical protein AGMMS50225_13600 [Betaproteobacteria bacterium]